VTETRLLNLSVLGETVEFDVGDLVGGAVEVALQSPSMSWGGAVVNAQRSLIGTDFYALEPDPVSFTAPGVSWRLDLSGVSKLRFIVSTVASGVGYPIAVCAVRSVSGT
jgi:hypothetical protein